MLNIIIIRKIFVWALAIAALILLVFVVSGSSSFKECIAETGTHENSQQPQEGFGAAVGRAPVIWQCLGHFIESNQAAIAAISTLFIALFTLILWQSMQKLWNAGERQLKHLEESVERQLRAYVFINGGSIELIATDQNRLFIRTFINFKNFGQTPGYNFVACTRMEIFDTNSPVFIDDLPVLEKSIIGPGDERRIPVVMGPIDPADLSAIRERTKSIFIWGRIDYVDAFEKPRYLKFYKMNGRELADTGWQMDQADKPCEAK